jgi:hypothetical protein
MRDFVFFPSAVLLIAAMIWLALLPGIGALPSGPVTGDGKNYSEIRIEGPYLNKILAGGDATTELIRQRGEPIRLLIAAEAGALSDDPVRGPHFELNRDIETQFSGMTVMCTVRLRPADDGGAMFVLLNYMAGRAGDSGWKRLELKPGFNDVSFEYRVPIAKGDQSFDYFAIRPEVPSKSRALIVESVTFKRLDRWAPPL